MPGISGRRSTGSVIWLVGGPSTGTSSIAREIQRLGSAEECWLHAGDEHLARQLPPGLVVMADPGQSSPNPRGWLVPVRDGAVTGRQTTGPLARRVLDGMYRAAAALAAAGNNVVLDDVLFEPEVAWLGITALRSCPTLLVHVSCGLETSLERERCRTDRIVGGVAAYAATPECIDHADLTVDTTHRSTTSAAQEILQRWRATPGGEAIRTYLAPPP